MSEENTTPVTDELTVLDAVIAIQYALTCVAVTDSTFRQHMLVLGEFVSQELRKREENASTK